MIGKIKSIHIKDLNIPEGTQVYHPSFGIYKIYEKTELKDKYGTSVICQNLTNTSLLMCKLEELKTIIVEYETGKGGRYSGDMGGNIYIPKETKKIPLKNSQWDNLYKMKNIDNEKISIKFNLLQEPILHAEITNE